MGNMKIGSRLLLGFGVTIMLTVLVGGYALRKQLQLQAMTKEIESRDLTTLQTVLDIIRGEDQMHLARQEALLAAFVRKDRLPSERPELKQQEWLQNRGRVMGLLSDLQTSAGQLQTLAISPERAEGWRKIRAGVKDAQDALRVLSPSIESQFASINNGNLPDAVERIANVDRAAAAYQTKLAAARQTIQDQMLLGRTEINQTAREMQNSVLIVLLITIGVGVFFAVVIHRSITVPLEEFIRVVERVGQGDLTPTVTTARGDEIGELGNSIARMVKGLKQVAVQTRSVAENVNSATAEILASTQQQAAATAEHAAAVQQASATMSQISQSGTQISERAKQVAATAEATSTASASGLQSVRNTKATMESIREQAEAVAENVIALSEKTQTIGDIIATVNDIAEQSHLLALNASIQAAAAGEHGRSFSVVASEMKNLAAQSKHATVQVRAILGDIQKGITSSVMLTEEAVKRADSGRQQAGVADQTIRKLTDSIEESVRAFQQIVGGSSQQQIGFEQVIHAFRNIGIASQETANSTKQSEKAAANLSSLAQELRSAVARYQI